jgi:hypothetical protein
VNDVLGDFNAPVTNKIFVFMDEVKIADDKMMDLFKNLVTGSTARSHKKFADAKYDESHLHIATSTNRDDFLKVEEKDRRVLALNSDVDKLIKHPFYVDLAITTPQKYFDWLVSSLEGTVDGIPEFGVKVFANFLYNWPIEETYDPRNIPGSPLLWDQKRKSLDCVAAFWFNCLKQGFVYKNEGAFAASSDQIRPDKWLDAVAFDEMWKEFVSEGYTKEKGAPRNKEDFWTRLQKYLPSEVKRCDEANAMLRATFTIIKLPELTNCRGHFDSVIPGMKFFFEVEDIRRQEGNDAAVAVEKRTSDRSERVMAITVDQMACNYPARTQKSKDGMTYADPRWPVMDCALLRRNEQPVKRLRVTETDFKDYASKLKNIAKKTKPRDEEDTPLVRAPPKPVRCSVCGVQFSKSPFPYKLNSIHNKWMHDECPDPSDSLHWYATSPKKGSNNPNKSN